MSPETLAATAAEEAAARAWPMFDRWAAMLARAESACCDNRSAAMCGELEDLVRTVGEALSGSVGAGAHGGAG